MSMILKNRQLKADGSKKTKFSIYKSRIFSNL